MGRLPIIMDETTMDAATVAPETTNDAATVASETIDDAATAASAPEAAPAVEGEAAAV